MGLLGGSRSLEGPFEGVFVVGHFVPLPLILDIDTLTREALFHKGHQIIEICSGGIDGGLILQRMDEESNNQQGRSPGRGRRITILTSTTSGVAATTGERSQFTDTSPHTNLWPPGRDPYLNPKRVVLTVSQPCPPDQKFSQFVCSILEHKLGTGVGVTLLRQAQEVVGNFPTFSSLKTLDCSPFGKRPPSLIDTTLLPQRTSLNSDNPQELHRNIQCDQCHQFPLRGKRYNCSVCEDFDLCERCFVSTSHAHVGNFRVVEKPRSETKKQKLRLHASTQGELHCAAGISALCANLQRMT